VGNLAGLPSGGPAVLLAKGAWQTLMLPSERNERLVKRVGIAICLLMALYIIIWLIRFISGNFHKALEQRNVPMEDGRGRVVETG